MEVMPMTRAVRSYAVIAALLAATQPGYAGPCDQSIAAVQLQLDAVIEQRAGSGPSRPESIEALRSYQPTPRSLAQALEASGNGSGLLSALDALDRAREADRSADTGRCNDELNKARQAIGLPRP
jgi:hypothetical protein